NSFVQQSHEKSNIKAYLKQSVFPNPPFKMRPLYVGIFYALKQRNKNEYLQKSFYFCFLSCNNFSRYYIF
ncbi:hypothetical protein, partial [Acinetobacter sp. UBA6526]|uniref:hypothetical protein n=1 Tax=Acinetobacter sp. UBA6526 TaxID=1945950 RepID=UPI00257A5BEA